jgi:hypothetical protein
VAKKPKEKEMAKNRMETLCDEFLGLNRCQVRELAKNALNVKGMTETSYSISFIYRKWTVTVSNFGEGGDSESVNVKVNE